LAHQKATRPIQSGAIATEWKLLFLILGTQKVLKTIKIVLIYSKTNRENQSCNNFINFLKQNLSHYGIK